MAYDLTTPASRLALALRREPYWTRIADGVSLGYRQGGRGGTWNVRWRDRRGFKRYKALGSAENGGDGGLSYEEANLRAIDIVLRDLAPSSIHDNSGQALPAGDAIDEASVARVIDAVRSTRFQPPAIDLTALAKDLQSARNVHLHRLREAPQVAADFQDLANAIDEVMKISDRITNDQTRKDMLLKAIMYRNKGLVSLMPDLELQRFIKSNTELKFLATACADISRSSKNFSREMGAPGHYFLLTRALPRIYEKHFGRPFGHSTDLMGQRTGPGVRFVMAAAELIGLRKTDGQPYSPETLRSAERKIRKRKAPIGSK